MANDRYAYGQVSDRTRRIREALEQVAQLSKIESFDVDEATALRDSLQSELSDVDDMFVAAALNILGKIVADGQIEENERQLIKELVDTYEQPVSDEPVTEVAGKRIVLTGDFDLEGGKTTAKEMIIAAGGRVINGSVSGRTDYLVVGQKGNPAWAFGSFGRKIKKAIDLRINGKSKVLIVRENALISFLEDNSPEAMKVLREKSESYRKQWENAKAVESDFNGLTAGQQNVFDLVKAGENVYLTGLGGTGKSYVLELIIEWARSFGKNVIVCAPTGIAALNVGGSTLHRALNILPEKTLQQNPYPFIKNGSPLPECDLMIVDEISMCRMDLFDYLSSVLKRVAVTRRDQGKPCCQLVVVGDFCQLPPVVTDAERRVLEQKYGHDIGKGYCFMGNEWDSWHFKKVELVEAIRQRDIRFVAALNACRIGDLKGVRWIEQHASKTADDHAIVLCGTNRQADRKNNEKLRALEGSGTKYFAKIDGEVTDRDMPTPKTLTLKPGARVMALVNNSESTYMNGTLGTIVKCHPDSVTVSFDDSGTYVVSPNCWEVTMPILVDGRTRNEVIGTFTQIPLKLAWAITIHKSQGQTFNSALVYPNCWEEGQLYTALSRLTSVEGLCLAHHINDESLVASPDVIDFLNKD